MVIKWGLGWYRYRDILNMTIAVFRMIAVVLTISLSWSTALAQLESVKALVVGIDYLNDPAPPNTTCANSGHLCLDHPRDDARQVFCALHPSVRQQASVFIEDEKIPYNELTRAECGRPRFIDNDRRKAGTYVQPDKENQSEAERLAVILEDYISTLKPGDIAFVYLSGHAFEYRGEPYLIPPVQPLDSLEPVDLISIEKRVVQAILDKESKLVLVLDACRQDFADIDNKKFRQQIFRLTNLAPPDTNDPDSNTAYFSSGLTPLSPSNAEKKDGSKEDTSSLTILFSTAPGQVAVDNIGFAAIFAEQLSRRQSFSSVVRNTQARFRDPEQRKRQLPYLQTNEPGEIYLRGASLNPSP